VSERERKLLTGNAAAAWAARLADVDYIPAFPITPQTEIIETLADWIDAGAIPARLVTLDSEHSMITAAGAAAATGVRTFTATSSQGLLYGMEMLYTIAGWRVPLVLVNVSRGLAAPLTLESDHNDVMAARDCGFVQLHAATCQEVLDLTLLAYRIAEDRRVRLPALVNLDGFYLSFTREPVELPPSEKVREFLPAFDPASLRFHASEPISQAVAVLGGGPYSYFRYEAHMAALNAESVFDEASHEIAEVFGRAYDAVERYRCEDAEVVYVMIGSFSTKAKEAVDSLREHGQAVGLVRPRLLRPFPTRAIRDALCETRAAVIVDQNLSLGSGGVLHTEIASALYGQPQAPMLLSFVGGLGGRDISQAELVEMVTVARDALKKGEPPPPRLLYTRHELKELRKLQVIAQVQREEEAAG
jgi:pyruvate ferredoxin oxidoreductase alpha subunit